MLTDMDRVIVVDADLDIPRHQEAVVALVSAYARDPFGQARDLPEDVRSALIAGLRAHPTTLVALAFDGGRPVGIAVCFVGFSTFAARPLINIHDLAVLPGSRGRGVGRRLLQHVEMRARERGCCKITLEVLDRNEVALRLYRAFGFGDGGGGRTWFLQKRL
jgi:ribosomal protein S18 acetylase RimI-like enzyme